MNDLTDEQRARALELRNTWANTISGLIHLEALPVSHSHAWLAVEAYVLASHIKNYASTDAAARPAETVSESVPTRHETAEHDLETLAKRARDLITEKAPWWTADDLSVRLGGTDAALIAAASPDVVLGLLDRLAHMTEARDNARAEVERLTGQIEAAKRICLGTHLGRSWHAVLDDVLRALDGAES